MAINKQLAEKILHSRELIFKSSRLSSQMGVLHGVYVGFSGGKDSQVLLDLVKSCFIPYYAVYNLTTIDPPDNVRFIFEKYPEVHVRRPPETFFKLVEKKGMPTMIRRYCCQILKEVDSAGEVVLTGVRAEESKRRAAYSETQIRSRRKEHQETKGRKSIDEILESQHKCVKGKDSVMVYPLLNWTEIDIWDYIETYNLPRNPCYDVSDRVGCIFCPFTNKKELNYYEHEYPIMKQNVIRAIQKYLDKRKPFAESEFRNAEEYYDWWRSKRSVDEWRERQLKQRERDTRSTGDYPQF